MIPADPALAASCNAPPPPPDGAPSSARALIDRQIAVLSRLAEIGMELAEACGRDALAAAAEAQEPASARDPGLVFARVARAVRMTIALQSRLLKDLDALDRAADQAEGERRDERRMRLRILLGQAVSAGVAPDDDRDEDAIEDEIERVSDDAFERLTEAEDDNLYGHPFDEAVAAICKDLGLSPDWTTRVRRAVEPPTQPLARRAFGYEPYPPPAPGWRAEPRPPPSASSSGGAEGADPGTQQLPSSKNCSAKFGAAGSPGLRGFAAPPEDDG